jgi:SWI/SNF-related matrix-associated actin-dependent regulator of chromatin subfamily A member 5
LTEEEHAERKKLYSEGFTNWTKKDFLAFVTASAKFGR